ncbi:hypothetical protein N7535_005930 [Penicillium sp. DV-2018c]|nr:hypothetical protein N7461_009508 [Penicillium sp. DV-2018c]KAJ5572270.1 hypothetical protein N7535_005930 [Penicillium sp. DV-2018c]
MPSSLTIKVSAGEDVSSVKTEVHDLVMKLGWNLVNERTIRKTFHFKTYTKVLDFNNAVGIRCKSLNHHPVTTLKHSTATFEWTTHSPSGISSKDVTMAKYCEARAKEIGTDTSSS